MAYSGQRTITQFCSNAITMIVLLLATSVTTADTLTLSSVKDNTLIQHDKGGSSNALGDAIYSGRTGNMGTFRRLRALVQFDTNAIPAGSTITSVTLRLNLIQSNTGNQTYTIHKVLGEWGEGTSFGGGGSGSDATPGDATWLHKFYPSTFWSTAGGDFDAASSASLVVGSTYTAYNWSSAGMTALVQSWVNGPASNFGLMIKGNEVNTRTAKKFASRENRATAKRPILIVQFTPPQPPKCTADVVKDQLVNVNDLLAVINNWGVCARPCPPACDADVSPTNGDCTVNVNDLLAVINSWGPCP